MIKFDSKFVSVCLQIVEVECAYGKVLESYDSVPLCTSDGSSRS